MFGRRPRAEQILPRLGECFFRTFAQLLHRAFKPANRQLFRQHCLIAVYRSSRSKRCILGADPQLVFLRSIDFCLRPSGFQKFCFTGRYAVPFVRLSDVFHRIHIACDGGEADVFVVDGILEHFKVHRTGAPFVYDHEFARLAFGVKLVEILVGLCAPGFRTLGSRDDITTHGAVSIPHHPLDKVFAAHASIRLGDKFRAGDKLHISMFNRQHIGLAAKRRAAVVC